MGDNVYIAYALWLLTGWFGGHRFYLGKFVSGFAMMALFFIGYSFAWAIVGYVFWVLWGVWWLFDLRLTGAAVEKNHKKEALKDKLRAQDLEERLRRLYELYESGAISKEEFEARKEILLG